MKTDPSAMADRLLATGDLGSALKRVKDELSTARRSRSRHRYTYWAAVESCLRQAAAQAPTTSLRVDQMGA